jgi:feruloyl esterase
MVPGMAHCVGGPGASELLHTTDVSAVPAEPGRDVLITMQRWVEQHEAPQKLIATRSDANGHIEQTRLVCAEPLRARYLGSGDPRDARRWVCRGEGR